MTTTTDTRETELHFTQLTELSSRIRTGEVSPVEVTELMLDRIERLDGELNAYQLVLAEEARRDAAAAERAVATGDTSRPLLGVPLAIKDLCDVEGTATGIGTIVRTAIAERDSTVVRRLREAGAVILGKTRLTEGAYAEHHPAVPTPLNPWDEATWVGASSSGSAAATAAGLAYGSLGSDTGGSIRFPSAATGLTGLKPTWGRVSVAGVSSFASSLDHIGPMARNVADCAAIFAVIGGHDAEDPSSLDANFDAASMTTGAWRGPLRVGVAPGFSEAFDATTLAMIDENIEVFRAAGAEIVPLSLPEVSWVADVWSLLCGVESAIAHEDTYPARRHEYGPVFVELLDRGLATSAIDYQRAVSRRAQLRRELQPILDSVDVLLVPSIGVASPTDAQMLEIGVGPRWASQVMPATVPFDFSGNPTLSLPGGFTERGTPLGFQLVGSLLGESTLLSVGALFQELTDHHRRHPAL